QVTDPQLGDSGDLGLGAGRVLTKDAIDQVRGNAGKSCLERLLDGAQPAWAVVQPPQELEALRLERLHPQAQPVDARPPQPLAELHREAARIALDRDLGLRLELQGRAQRFEHSSELVCLPQRRRSAPKEHAVDPARRERLAARLELSTNRVGVRTMWDLCSRPCDAEEVAVRTLL